MFRKFLGLAALCAGVGLGWVAYPAASCPLCDQVDLTFAEEMDSADVVVIAEEVKVAAPKSEPPAKISLLSPAAKSKFRITQILKGEQHLGKTQEFEVLYFGSQPAGTKFYAIANDPLMLTWSTPIPLTERSFKYLSQLPSLPKEGAARLTFFYNHLEDEEDMLARDAYDEFAKAPYEWVKDLKPKMDHDQLVAWIKNDKIAASRRRLYLVMLGACGSEKDLVMLKQMLTSGERESKFVLDALVACYLTLAGPEGMTLIEDAFLKNPKADYADTWSAIQALRVLGQMSERIPKERLVQGFRHMLDRPQLADLVIPDLSRWEDWDSMDRLVELFKESQDSGSFIRVPVIRFLMVCPRPEAKKYLDELAQLDPNAMKRATTFPALIRRSDKKDDSNVARPKKADKPAAAPAAGEEEKK